MDVIVVELTKISVIMVNDGSIENTAEIVKRYPLKLIKLTPNQGRIVACNTGAREVALNTLVFDQVRVIAEKTA